MNDFDRIWHLQISRNEQAMGPEKDSKFVKSKIIDWGSHSKLEYLSEDRSNDKRHLGVGTPPFLFHGSMWHIVLRQGREGQHY